MEYVAAWHEHALRAYLHKLHAHGACWRLQLRLLFLLLEQCFSDVALSFHLFLFTVILCDFDDRQLGNSLLTCPVLLLLSFVFL